MSDIIRKKAGEFLLYENADSSEMYYLQSGSLAVIKRKGDQNKQIGTIRSGELVGEMSFFDEKPRSTSVQALSDCELKVIPRDKFNLALEEMPAWQRAVVNTLIARLRSANAKIKI